MHFDDGCMLASLPTVFVCMSWGTCHVSPQALSLPVPCSTHPPTPGTYVSRMYRPVPPYILVLRFLKFAWEPFNSIIAFWVALAFHAAFAWRSQRSFLPNPLFPIVTKNAMATVHGTRCGRGRGVCQGGCILWAGGWVGDACVHCESVTCGVCGPRRVQYF